MARILVADDNRDLARTIERALKLESHQVIIAHTGSEALSGMHRFQPDVVVLDVVMPEMDGFEVCRQARANPDLARIPILLLTVKAHIDDVVKGFKAGADDYLTKPFDLRELTVRIEALLRRTYASKPTTNQLKVGPLVLDLSTCQIRVDDRTEHLTPRETDLLYYMMQHAGNIVSIKRALQDVWGYTPDAGNPDLVRAHIRNLRVKIEPDPSHPIHIKTVPRHGYLIPYRNGTEASATAEPQRRTEREH